MRTIRWLTGATALAVLSACGGGGSTPPDVPTPGTLAVALTGTVPPGGGAIMLTVSGATLKVDTLNAGAGFTDYSRRLTTKSFRTVLVGTVAAGTIATIHVPDTRKTSDYSATVTAVANGTTFAPMATRSFTTAVTAP
jgi:hypothetical protein